MPRGDTLRNTWQAAQAYFPPPYIERTPQLPSFPLAGALDQFKRFQRWTPERKERTNEPIEPTYIAKMANHSTLFLLTSPTADVADASDAVALEAASVWIKLNWRWAATVGES